MIPKPMPPNLIKKRRRELNNKMFPSEKWFEKMMCENKIGGYRRNVCIDRRYFGDFVWRCKKIVVEIDGPSHRDSCEYDRIRDEHLKSKGYTVKRIPWGNTKVGLTIIEFLKLKIGVVEVKAFSKSKPKRFIKQMRSYENSRIIEDLERRRAEFKKNLKARNKHKTSYVCAGGRKK